MRCFTLCLLFSFASLLSAKAAGITPPASLVGKAYQFSFSISDYVDSSPWQLEFDSTTYNFGFAGSLIHANWPYTYANGVIVFPDGDEWRLSFENSTSGTWEFWEYDDGNYSLDDSGTFTVGTSLVEKTDWQRTEALDSPLSDQYWNVSRPSVDTLAYDDGELSFIFAARGDDYGDDGQYHEIEIQYGRTLPMDENWQVVLEDMYAAPGLSDFKLELDLDIKDPEFACELSFKDYGNGREFGVVLEQQLPSGDWEYARAYVTANEDTRISSGGNVRIVHIASSRDLIFEYQPDGASEWSELARLNLESGSFQGENAYGSLTGGILSATGPRMTVDIEADVGESGVATQIADLEIGGIEIGSYTPAATPVDSDGDGLDDSVETNTGVYVSESDTGTDPNNADSSGDGFSDGAIVAVGFDPNTDYSKIADLAVEATQDLRIGAEIASVTNGAATLQIVLEESADLSNWSHRETVDLVVPLQAGETTKFFRYAMQGAPSDDVEAPAVPDGFALIPGGSFQMGDALDGDSNAPVVTVAVSAFYMGKYEVTKAEWDEVRTWGLSNGYTDLPTGGGKAANHPVHSINWYAMVKWCNARSEQAGLTPCYTVSGSTYREGSSDAVECDWTANGYRLPTEAEWEKAARGGLTGKRFPWGDTISHANANYYESTWYSYDVGDGSGYHPDYDSGDTPYTSAVGSFAANGYGLYDMAGNVWEWCWDWYAGSYSDGAADPRGAASGSDRVRRGGCWIDNADYCRVAGRDNDYPSSYEYYDSGFRVALRSVPQ